MAISVVLRLVEQALRAGRLAGEVEVVETGERALVQDGDELIRFLRNPRGAAPEEDRAGCGDDEGGESWCP